MAQTREHAPALALGVGRPSSAVYGSDLMVEVLRELEIPYIALNPGASYRGLHDSIVNFGKGPSPEMILCPHEEIAVSLANGYAKVTGKPMATGLHDVVGLQHAAMSLFVAWCDRTPIINLGGGGPQDASHRRSTDWVHTALVQGNLVRDFVKYDDQPYSVEAVPESLLRAHRIATTEPMGPVYICLDSDVQEQRITSPMTVPDVSLFQAPAPPGPNMDVLRQAAGMLAAAQWPVIVAGEMGRNPEAVRGLRELAELLSAPVIDAGGPFNFPNTHPLDLTEAREEALRDADVVLALDVPNLGVPLGPTVREREPLKLAIRPDTPIIHITMHDLERQSWVTDVMWLMPVAVPICADVAQSLTGLIELCRKALEADSGGKRRVEERYRAVEAVHNKAREQAEAWFAQAWNQEPISSARVNGEIKERVKGQPWALLHAHGARWRQILELTEPGHGIGGGRGGGVGSGAADGRGRGAGIQGQRADLRQRVGGRRLLHDVQRAVGGGQVRHPPADGDLQQPLLLQRRGAPGADGGAAGPAGGEQGDRHPDQRTGAGLCRALALAGRGGLWAYYGARRRGAGVGPGGKGSARGQTGGGGHTHAGSIGAAAGASSAYA